MRPEFNSSIFQWINSICKLFDISMQITKAQFPICSFKFKYWTSFNISIVVAANIVTFFFSGKHFFWSGMCFFSSGVCFWSVFLLGEAFLFLFGEVSFSVRGHADALGATSGSKSSPNDRDGWPWHVWEYCPCPWYSKSDINGCWPCSHSANAGCRSCRTFGEWGRRGETSTKAKSIDRRRSSMAAWHTDAADKR